MRLPIIVPAVAAYRHRSTSSTVFVVVCDEPCSSADMAAVERAARGNAMRLRYGFGLPNVHLWVTAAGRRTGGELRGQLSRIIAEDLAPPPSDRCYVA